MQLFEIMKSAKFKMVEGSEHLWDCFGYNSRNLEFSGFEDGQGSGVSCVFDFETQQVYEVNIYTDNNKWYRWIDSNYINAYKNECVERKIPFEIVGDDNQWIDLDNIADVFRKVNQVIDTGICDNEVTIELNIEDDLLLNLCLIAHKNNITLNQLMNDVLQNAVNRTEQIIVDSGVISNKQTNIPMKKAGLQKLIEQVELILSESGNNSNFNVAAWVVNWLEQPNAALDNAKPIELIDTIEGQKLVSSLLAKMQSGAYA